MELDELLLNISEDCQCDYFHASHSAHMLRCFTWQDNEFVAKNPPLKGESCTQPMLECFGNIKAIFVEASMVIYQAKKAQFQYESTLSC
jgi:hypothetical protein